MMAKRASSDRIFERPSKRCKLFGGAGSDIATDHNNIHAISNIEDGDQEHKNSETSKQTAKTVENHKNSCIRDEEIHSSVAPTTNDPSSILLNTTVSESVQPEPESGTLGAAGSSQLVQHLDTTSDLAQQASEAAFSLLSGVTGHDLSPSPASVGNQSHTALHRQSTGKEFQQPKIVDERFKNFWLEPISKSYPSTLGMKNPNQLCYRNAVLIALLNAPSFVRYLKDWYMKEEQHQFADNNIHILTWLHKVRGLAIDTNKDKEFQEEVRLMWKQIGIVNERPADHLLPTGPWDADVEYEGGGNGQQDARSFLQWLYRAIEQQMDVSHLTPTLNWEWTTKARLVARSICPNCKNWLIRRDNVEANSIINLQIQEVTHDNHDTLEHLIGKALHSRVTVDRPVCKKKNVAGSKWQKRFQHAPPVLTLRIERGSYGPKPVKDNRNVRLPKTLDISQWLNKHEYGDGSKLQYKLSSIVVHKGQRLKSGLYTCLIRSQKSGDDSWTEVNDAHSHSGLNLDHTTDSDYVTWLGSKPDYPETPYILIYDKIFNKDDTWPGRKPNIIKDWDTEDAQTATTQTDQANTLLDDGGATNDEGDLKQISAILETVAWQKVSGNSGPNSMRNYSKRRNWARKLLRPEEMWAD